MVVTTVIIFFGAQEKKNSSNILPHIICILRGFFLFGFWKYDAKTCHSVFLFCFVLPFWCTLVTGVNAAKIRPQEVLILSLKKHSECFSNSSLPESFFFFLLVENLKNRQQFSLLWAHAVSFDVDQEGILSYCEGIFLRGRKSLHNWIEHQDIIFMWMLSLMHNHVPF